MVMGAEVWYKFSALHRQRGQVHKSATLSRWQRPKEWKSLEGAPPIQTKNKQMPLNRAYKSCPRKIDIPFLSVTQDMDLECKYGRFFILTHSYFQTLEKTHMVEDTIGHITCPRQPMKRGICMERLDGIKIIYDIILI